MMKKQILIFLLLALALLCLAACQPKPCKTHEFSAWSVTKDPTCIAAGEESRMCAKCQEVQIRPVEIIAHQYITVEGKAPTCAAEGLTAGEQCSMCQDWKTPQASIEKTDHTYMRTQIGSYFSYVVNDEKERYCVDCEAYIEGSQLKIHLKDYPAFADKVLIDKEVIKEFEKFDKDFPVKDAELSDRFQDIWGDKIPNFPLVDWEDQTNTPEES